MFSSTHLTVHTPELKLASKLMHTFTASLSIFSYYGSGCDIICCCFRLQNFRGKKKGKLAYSKVNFLKTMNKVLTLILKISALRICLYIAQFNVGLPRSFLLTKAIPLCSSQNSCKVATRVSEAWPPAL